MIVYEIEAKVREDVVIVYEEYMCETHIADLLETGYFESAEMAKVSDGHYRMRYLAKDRETLNKYFETDAESLREDFIKHFPEGVEVSRSILEILHSSHRLE